MGNGDHRSDGNCYRHKHVGDSHAQLSFATLRTTLSAHGRGTKVLPVHKSAVRTIPILSGTCKIAPCGNGPPPGLAVAGGIFRASLSFIWAHSNVASIFDPLKLPDWLCSLHCPPIVG